MNGEKPKLPRSSFAPEQASDSNAVRQAQQMNSFPNSTQLDNTQTCEMENSNGASIMLGEKSVSKGPEGADYMSGAPHGVDTTRLSTILQQEAPQQPAGGTLQNHLAFSFSKIEQVTQNSHQF